jgi:hypothetical protein
VPWPRSRSRTIESLESRTFLNAAPTVNQPPEDWRQTSGSIPDNAETGYLVAKLELSDPNPGDTGQYTLLQDEDDRFVIVGDELRVGSNTLFDSERYTMTVQFTDNAGLLGPLKSLQVRVYDAEGPEANIDAAATVSNTSRAVATDASGNSVVTWIEAGVGGNQVLAQRFGLGGGAQGAPIEVSAGIRSSVGMDADGNFVVAWISAEVLAQRFDASGGPIGGPITVGSSGAPQDVEVAVNAGGDFAITWSSGNNVFVRRFDAAGSAVAPAAQVNQLATTTQDGAAVTINDDGNYIVAWRRESGSGSTAASAVFARRFNADGSANGAEFRADPASFQSSSAPSIAMDADGDFVVAWQRASADSADIFAQMFNADATRHGREFYVNGTKRLGQRDPSVAMNAGGEFVVSWASFGQDGDDEAVYAREFTVAGLAKNSEIRVNTTTAGRQWNSSVAYSEGGTFVVAWEGPGVNLQQYHAGDLVTSTGVFLNGNFLEVSGTLVDEDVKVIGSTTGRYTVHVFGDTRVINGAATVVRVDLFDGDDYVSLDRIYVNDRILVTTGDGEDRLDLGLNDVVSSRNEFSLQMGLGDDLLRGQRMYIGGDQFIEGERGDDTIILQGSADGPVFVLGTSSAGRTSVLGQQGNDTILMSYSYVVGFWSVEGGIGNNTFDIRYSASTGQTVIGDGTGGFGSSHITFDANFVTQFTTIGTGPGDSTLFVAGLLGLPVLSLMTHDGNDRIDVRNITTGLLSINSGACNDIVDVRASLLDAFYVKLAEDDDELTVFGNLVHFETDFDGQGGVNRLFDLGNDFRGPRRRMNFA